MVTLKLVISGKHVHRIHGTGIFACIWLKFTVNVLVNIPYINPMRYIDCAAYIMYMLNASSLQKK